MLFAGVVELADALDSKSCGSDTVWVRLPPPAPFRGIFQSPEHIKSLEFQGFLFFTKKMKNLLKIKKVGLKVGLKNYLTYAGNKC